jgi:hypothetical protein
MLPGLQAIRQNRAGGDTYPNSGAFGDDGDVRRTDMQQRLWIGALLALGIAAIGYYRLRVTPADGTPQAALVTTTLPVLEPDSLTPFVPANADQPGQADAQARTPVATAFEPIAVRPEPFEQPVEGNTHVSDVSTGFPVSTYGEQPTAPRPDLDERRMPYADERE